MCDIRMVCLFLTFLAWGPTSYVWHYSLRSPFLVVSLLRCDMILMAVLSMCDITVGSSYMWRAWHEVSLPICDITHIYISYIYKYIHYSHMHICIYIYTHIYIYTYVYIYIVWFLLAAMRACFGRCGVSFVCFLPSLVSAKEHAHLKMYSFHTHTHTQIRAL